MRITLKAINDELARRGVTERLARASGYFYFEFGEAAGWLDRTVRVPTVNALTLDQLAGRLIPGTDLNLKDGKYKSTPLGWAVHGWCNPPAGNHGRQREVVTLLVAGGCES